jgi:hypothetical protein
MRIGKKDKRKPLLSLLVSAFLIIFVGCGSGKEKEIPGANIAGIRASIRKILISPLAFDGAIVAVEGLVHDVKKESLTGGKVATMFKLSDIQGDFINVSTTGVQQISENDYLIVGGIYRRAKNEIEAQEIEKIQLEEKTKTK